MTFRLNEDRYSCWEDAEPLPTSWWFFDGDSEMINPLHGLSWTLGTKKMGENIPRAEHPRIPRDKPLIKDILMGYTIYVFPKCFRLPGS
jgi:hypothetical protein